MASSYSKATQPIRMQGQQSAATFWRRGQLTQWECRISRYKKYHMQQKQWECRISRHNKNYMLPKCNTMLMKHYLFRLDSTNGAKYYPVLHSTFVVGERSPPPPALSNTWLDGLIPKPTPITALCTTVSTELRECEHFRAVIWNQCCSLCQSRYVRKSPKAQNSWQTENLMNGGKPSQSLRDVVTFVEYGVNFFVTLKKRLMRWDTDRELSYIFTSLAIRWY